MPCRAVTFDFNGTLSDDEDVLFGVYAALFAEHGHPLGRDEYFGRLAGLSEHEIVQSWLGDRDDLEAIVRERIDRYRGAVTDGSTVSEGMRSAVRLAASRVPIAVVSGATRAEIEPVVAAAGLGDVFRAIVDGEDVAHGKPHPESYELAVSLLGRHAPGLVPAEVVAFEDTEAGVASARAAGVRCIALAGTLPRDRLSQAHEIVETIDEPLLRRLLQA
jgi:beta-phosphoglucomutase-like phosphatase (HAD superfamily)